MDDSRRSQAVATPDSDNRDRSIPEKTTTKFRKLLHSGNLEFLLDAHNGITAKIAEEAGFKGIWAGGLCMSAQYGVRDSNEASWTQVLDMLEFMSDAVEIPILLDGDTGYGNFNNVRRLVRKLEQRSIAAVCIEDKLFPKTNSFIDGTKQQLADIDEFCSRIKAGKDAQSDDDFAIITRVEAFIAGWGLSEALKRAEAYHEAGADGILIHSALHEPSEVLAFKKEWADRSPVVIVPTKYFATPTETFKEAGFSIAIWANQILRAAIPAMQQCASMLADSETLTSIEADIVPVKEIFRLQNAAELKSAEGVYLPSTQSDCGAVIVGDIPATGVHTVQSYALDSGKRDPMLENIVSGFNGVGIKNVGHAVAANTWTAEMPGLRRIEADHSGNIDELSLFLASLENPEMSDPTDLILCRGDILLEKRSLETLRDASDRVTLLVESDWEDASGAGNVESGVTCSEPFSRTTFMRTVLLKDVGSTLPRKHTHGEWTGAMKIPASQISRIRRIGLKLKNAQPDANLAIDDLLKKLVQKGVEIRIAYTTGYWQRLEIEGEESKVAATSA